MLPSQSLYCDELKRNRILFKWYLEKYLCDGCALGERKVFSWKTKRSQQSKSSERYFHWSRRPWSYLDNIKSSFKVVFHSNHIFPSAALFRKLCNSSQKSLGLDPTMQCVPERVRPGQYGETKCTQTQLCRLVLPQENTFKKCQGHVVMQVQYVIMQQQLLDQSGRCISSSVDKTVLF